GGAHGDADDQPQRYRRRRAAGRAPPADGGGAGSGLGLGQRRAPRAPVALALPLGAQRQQDVLARGLPQQVDPQRQALLALGEGERDRREPGDVGHRRERRELARAGPFLQVATTGVVGADGDRQLGQRGGEQRVVGRERGDQPPREGLQL